MQLAQILQRQRGLYHGRCGRLVIFLRHNMVIIGRPPSLHPPTSEDHEVRLPYSARIRRAIASSLVAAAAPPQVKEARSPPSRPARSATIRTRPTSTTRPSTMPLS